MAIENLYATSLSSGAVSTSANALGSTAGTWTTDTGTTNWTAAFQMGDPSGALITANNSTFTARVRKEAGQSGTPTAQLIVRSPTGTTIHTGTTTNITSGTGQDLSVTVSQSLLNANRNDVVVEIVATSAGGNPSTRSSVQLDYIRWDADVEAGPIPKAGSDTGSIAISESTSVILQADKAASDTGSIAVSESASVVVTFDTKSASDTGSIAVSETSDVQSSQASSPTYVDSTRSNDANTSSVVVAVPAGVAIDDVVILSLEHWGTAPTITWPTGFTQIGTTTASGSQRLSVAWKRLTAADTGNYTVTLSTANWSILHAVAIRGAISSGNPIEAFQITTAISNHSITAGGPSFLVHTVAHENLGTYTPPTGYTIIEDAEYHSTSYLESATGGTKTSAGASHSGGTGGIVAALISVEGGAPPAPIEKTASDSASIAISETTDIQTIELVTKSASDTGSIAVTDTGSVFAHSYKWPTAIDASGRFINDQDGNVWPLRGYTLWALPVKVGAWNETASIALTLENTFASLAANNYNAVLVSIFGSATNGGYNNGLTHDSISPFTTGVTFNETYWSRMDQIINTAASHGITVIIDVFDAWSFESNQIFSGGLSSADATSIGTQIGNRYKTHDNIIWMMGGDYFGTFDSTMSDCLDAIAATGDTHLVTVDYYAESGSYVDSGGSPPSTLGANYADFAYVYTYNASYLEIQRNYQYTISPTPATRPSIYMDGIYDQNSAAYIKIMQDQLGWAFTSGSPGYLYGSEGTWAWNSGAYAAITSETFPNNNYPPVMDYLTALPGWEDLIPDHDESLNFLTSARGTKVNAIPSGGGNGEYGGGNNYLTGAVTADGKLGVVYTPVARTFTIDETQLVGTYSATWLDPVDGSTTPATPGSSYTTPGNNSGGNGNWYLILEEDIITPKAGSDTSSISVTETTETFVTVTASDTAAISVAETTSGSVTASASDTGSLAVTETTESALSVSVSDTGSIELSESAVQVIAAVASDTAAISIAETTSGSVTAEASDTGSLSVTESVANDVTLEASDTGSVAVTETTDGSVTATASDTGSIAISETADIQVVATISVNDTGSLAATESVEIAVTTSASDTGSIAVTETAEILVFTSANDSTAIAVGETVEGSVTATASDTAALSITETAGNAVEFSASDTGSVAVSETTDIQVSGGQNIAGSDTGSIAVSETSDIQVVQTIEASDSGAIAVTETTEILGQVIEKSASDSGSIAVSETTSGSVTAVASDTSPLAVTEVTSGSVDATATDEAAISIAESIATSVDLSATDTIAIAITDSSSVVVVTFIVASDTGAISVSETSNVNPLAYNPPVVKAYDQGIWKTAQVKVYKNGQWVVANVKVYRDTQTWI